MKNRVVLKLFFLTSGLCFLIVLAIFIGQTLFFEKFYVHKKVDQLTEAIESFRQNYLNTDEDTELLQLEQEFYHEHDAWIVVLDEHGYIKGTEDFYIELDRTFIFKNSHRANLTREYIENEPIRIPIFYLFNQEEPLSKGSILDKEFPTVQVRGMQIENNIYPYQLYWRSENIPDNFFDSLGSYSYILWDNKQLQHEAKEYEDVTVSIHGHVKDIHIPEVSHRIFTNPLLLDKLREFQVSLLLKKNVSEEVKDFEQDNIEYKLFIIPSKNSSGETVYIYTMASLQPVNEAVQVIKQYYIYIVLFVVALVLLAAFYYSKGITLPLLRVNAVTKRMANLDFSERITVKTKDEIGELSNNINYLSSTLQSYINQLQQDVEKERRLEQTRKDFIAGVSHELKTPLSIMKSCIAILQDGVAVEKKDHYFHALGNEVDRMDRLIADMLELAKYESGTYKMEVGSFFIDELIYSVIDQISIKTVDQKINIELKLHSIEVIGNQNRIEQVMMNLLSNALQHTPDKGKIIVTTINGEGQVKITVENEGKHIKEDQLEKIWDSFYQGDKAQRSKKGTGLGLAISKNILLLHDVKYGVFNTKDGVCFYFHLNKTITQKI